VEDYPFDETAAVIKHSGNKKMFALIAHMDGRLYINLKCEPFKADFLRSVFQSVVSGWHMNKTHWNTVYIDGDVPQEEVFEMIQHSYDLVKPKAKKQMIHSPSEQVKDWHKALAYLQEGNKRFLENHPMKRDTTVKDREILKDGQKPFAVILTCSDSRMSPEIFFDEKMGDIFVIRNAGNIVNETVLGSIEYAVGHLKSPLVVVVGHSSCGAVTGALQGGAFPKNLQSIVSTIRSDIAGHESIDDAIHANIHASVAKIKENEAVKNMGAVVIGAFYNIESGEVVFDLDGLDAEAVAL
jgi:carbonic anhydrase